MTMSRVSRDMTFEMKFDLRMFAPSEPYEMSVYNQMFSFTVVSGEDSSFKDISNNLT